MQDEELEGVYDFRAYHRTRLRAYKTDQGHGDGLVRNVGVRGSFFGGVDERAQGVYSRCSNLRIAEVINEQLDNIT